MVLENYSNFGLKLGQDLGNRWNLPSPSPKTASSTPSPYEILIVSSPRYPAKFKLGPIANKVNTTILNNSTVLIQE